MNVVGRLRRLRVPTIVAPAHPASCQVPNHRYLASHRLRPPEVTDAVLVPP